MADAATKDEMFLPDQLVWQCVAYAQEQLLFDFVALDAAEAAQLLVPMGCVQVAFIFHYVLIYCNDLIARIRLRQETVRFNAVQAV
jgi:hypothetical protein